jgi:hypothetical protein
MPDYSAFGFKPEPTEKPEEKDEVLAKALAWHDKLPESLRAVFTRAQERLTDMVGEKTGVSFFEEPEGFLKLFQDFAKVMNRIKPYAFLGQKIPDLTDAEVETLVLMTYVTSEDFWESTFRRAGAGGAALLRIAFKQQYNITGE